MKHLKIKESDKILIVAPHPDDETLGCGGLLAKYGKQCDILLVTDGRQGFFEHCTITNPDQVAQKRKKELFCAAEIFKVNSVMCLDLPNENLKPYLSKLKKQDLKKYTKVFIPGYQEGHHEHVLVNRTLRKMMIFQWCKAMTFEYEVCTPMIKPDYFLDISNSMDKKLEAVSRFKSQIECYDYLSMCEGLNRFRGCTQFVEYAEVYMYRKLLRDVLRDFARKMKRI